jgi:hypothetical protein
MHRCPPKDGSHRTIDGPGWSTWRGAPAFDRHGVNGAQPPIGGHRGDTGQDGACRRRAGIRPRVLVRRGVCSLAPERLHPHGCSERERRIGTRPRPRRRLIRFRCWGIRGRACRCEAGTPQGGRTRAGCRSLRASRPPWAPAHAQDADGPARHAVALPCRHVAAGGELAAERADERALRLDDLVDRIEIVGPSARVLGVVPVAEVCVELTPSV